MTQQLARADRKVLEACQRDAQSLDDLCSFRLLDADDYLGLDWAPPLLEAVGAASGAPSELLASLATATAGDDEVNPDYRESPDTVWEHPVSFLLPHQVDDVARSLRELDGSDFLYEVDVNAALEGRPAGSVPVNPQEYLPTQFRALLLFYEEAARRGLCTIMWLD